MNNNSIAILQDYESSIESSFKKMEKSAKSFEGSDQSQQNLIITTLNNELGTAKTNIGLMKMELSNLKEEGNISKWQEIINELQKTHDSFKAQMIQMRNKKNSMNDDPSNLDVRVDMSKMSSQQVMNRGDDLLNADREAISRIKNVVNQDLDTMKEVNKELLSQNEKLIMCMIVCILLVIIAIVVVSLVFGGGEDENTQHDSFNNGDKKNSAVFYNKWNIFMFLVLLISSYLV